MKIPDLEADIAEVESMHEAAEMFPKLLNHLDTAKDEDFAKSRRLMDDIIASVYAMPPEMLARALEGQMPWRYNKKSSQAFTSDSMTRK